MRRAEVEDPLDLRREGGSAVTVGRHMHTGRMVRTGARAQALQKLLNRAGLVSAASNPAAPRLDDLSDEAKAQVVAAYRALGGTEPVRPPRPGAWDLAFEGGLVVELDEELHFNRYRAKTLEPPWSADLPWYEDYQGFCRHYETKCLDAGKWGKRWTTPSCESMFGPPGDVGELEGPGAPRWKQRALYDAMKDITALASGAVRLARLSVWDTIGDITLGDALVVGAPVDSGRLRDLVHARTAAAT